MSQIAKTLADGDVGDQIAGFFDGGHIDPASSETGGVARLFVLSIALAGGPAMPDRGSRGLSSRPTQRTA
jgi:hypothetical protein